jgi:hypothetical protein
MKEVPNQGRPRGPGGRGGIEFVADGTAVEDMSRELLGHVFWSMILRRRHVYFAEWSGVRCDWRGIFFAERNLAERGTTPVAIERVRKSFKTWRIERRRCAKESVIS